MKNRPGVFVSQEVKDKVVELEEKILKIASRFSDGALELDDLFQEVCEYLLTHMKPGDEHGRYIGNAVLFCKSSLAKKATYLRYVGEESEISGFHENEEDGSDVFELFLGDEQNTVEDYLIQKEELMAIQKVIDSLSQENKKVISMLYCGTKQVDIAREFGVSEAAISTRIKTISIQLRQRGLSLNAFNRGLI